MLNIWSLPLFSLSRNQCNLKTNNQSSNFCVNFISATIYIQLLMDSYATLGVQLYNLHATLMVVPFAIIPVET